MHEAFIKGRSIEFAFVHGNLAKISELFLFNHQNVPQFHKTRKGQFCKSRENILKGQIKYATTC